ncbi:MAG: MoxR family ATPase [Eubacteriaceae bacterium]|jgi:MoxR-like ATPase|nr:MoxR family ATPase [Eubacteriaceae bacterium]
MDDKDRIVLERLAKNGVSQSLAEEVIRFRKKSQPAERDIDRISTPMYNYYGTEVWEMAIAAIVRGENILLSGPKATGKNVLADNLSFVFSRPSYNISFHLNTDSSALIGTDTFEDNTVRFRKGPVYLCAVNGGFGIFDEINMAKNDAVSVLHSCLDYRRIIDVPGYEKIGLHDDTRFIGTMNYGYAGTKELNEALVSRFLVIEMPAVDEATLEKILTDSFPLLSHKALEQFSGLFLDLQLKALNGEITTKPVDLRGMLAAIKTIQIGLSPALAVKMGITNKTFDSFEREIIDDAAMSRIPLEWTAEDVFG